MSLTTIADDVLRLIVDHAMEDFFDLETPSAWLNTSPGYMAVRALSQTCREYHV